MQPLRLNKSFNENAQENNDMILAAKKEKDEKTKESLPWIEKFRPTGLDDLVTHEEIVSIFKSFLDLGDKGYTNTSLGFTNTYPTCSSLNLTILVFKLA